MLETQAIRKLVAGYGRDVSPEFAAAVATSIVRVLPALPELLSAPVVSLYCDMADEIDLGEACEKLTPARSPRCRS